MKKKILVLLCIVSIGICGCGSSNAVSSNVAPSSATEKSSESKNSEKSNTDSLKSTELEVLEDSETENAERTLEGIENYMVEKGCLTGDRSEKSAELVGAISGFGYSGSEIEIYEYDTSSDSYKLIESGEDVPIEGMDDYSVHFSAVNGEFALLFSNNGDADQGIIDIFNAY